MRHFTGANAQSPHERSADFGIYRGAVKIDVAPAPPLSVRPVVTFLAVVRLLVPVPGSCWWLLLAIRPSKKIWSDQNLRQIFEGEPDWSDLSVRSFLNQELHVAEMVPH